jgi:hypothetical protein
MIPRIAYPCDTAGEQGYAEHFFLLANNRKGLLREALPISVP